MSFVEVDGLGNDAENQGFSISSRAMESFRRDPALLLELFSRDSLKLQLNGARL